MMDEDLQQHSVPPAERSDEDGATMRGEGAAALVGQAGEAIVVTRPAPGQTVEIQAAAGQTYVLNFPPDEAQVEIQGEDFVLAFDDNGDGTTDSRIVFLDLVTIAEGGDAPTTSEEHPSDLQALMPQP